MNLRRPPRPLRYALQVLVVAVFTLWVWQGPVRVNLYDDRRPPAWGWHLFRSQGGDACDVRFYEHVDEGDRYIPRWRVLGYGIQPVTPPRTYWESV